MISHLRITCEEATRRISRGLDQPLDLGERLGLYPHLAACKFCRQFRRQTRILHEAFRSLSRAEGSEAGVDQIP